MLREPQLLVVKFETPLLTVLNTALGKGAAGKLTEEKKRSRWIISQTRSRTNLYSFTLAMSMALFYRRRSSAANTQLSGKSSRRGSRLPSIGDDNTNGLCEYTPIWPDLCEAWLKKATFNISCGPGRYRIWKLWHYDISFKWRITLYVLTSVQVNFGHVESHDTIYDYVRYMDICRPYIWYYDKMFIMIAGSRSVGL